MGCAVLILQKIQKGLSQLECDRVELSGAIDEVLEVRGSRAIRIRLTLSELPPEKTK